MKLESSLRASFGALVLGAVPLGADPASQSPLGADAVGLLQEMRAQRLLEPGELAERLADAVGTDASGLLAVLESRSVPAFEEGETQVLSEPQERLVLEALRLLGRTTCMIALEGDPERVADLGERERAARVALYGVVGGADDVPALLDLARFEDGAPDLVLRGVRRGVEDLVGRDAAALGILRPELRRLPTELGVAVLGAVGGGTDSATLALFEDALAFREDLVLVALGELGECSRVSGELARRVLELVRARLDDPSERVRMQAANACGAFEDLEAVDALIAMLEDEHRGVATTAHRALVAIGGVKLPAARAAWANWCAEERAWGERERLEAYGDLTSADAFRRELALKAVLEHRLHRHASVEVVAELLRLENEELRLLAVRGLGGLGTDAAREHLRGAADDEDVRVRAAVVRALGS